MTVTSVLKRYPNGTLWINQAKTKNIYSLNPQYFFFIIRKNRPIDASQDPENWLEYLPKTCSLTPLQSPLPNIIWDSRYRDQMSLILGTSISNIIIFSAEHQDLIPSCLFTEITVSAYSLCSPHPEG